MSVTQNFYPKIFESFFLGKSDGSPFFDEDITGEGFGTVQCYLDLRYIESIHNMTHGVVADVGGELISRKPVIVTATLSSAEDFSELKFKIPTTTWLTTDFEETQGGEINFATISTQVENKLLMSLTFNPPLALNSNFQLKLNADNPPKIQFELS